jgi:hypothetical protein
VLVSFDDAPQAAVDTNVIVSLCFGLHGAEKCPHGSATPVRRTRACSH